VLLRMTLPFRTGWHEYKEAHSNGIIHHHVSWIMVAEYPIAARVSVVGEEHHLSEEVAIALFRITQEALRNVWRHSGATSAEITVEFDENKTRITVNDNGKGFNLPENIGGLARDGKLGLAGMQERAQLIGGTLTVQSQPDNGTSIIVELPV